MFRKVKINKKIKTNTNRTNQIISRTIETMNETKQTNNEEVISINVGGTQFLTTWGTLRKHPETLLGSLSTSSKYYNHEKKYFFFDRNPDNFNTILDYYRNGEIHLPTQVCGWIWKQEFLFWGIPEKDIAECCFSTFIKYDNDKKVVDYITNDSYCSKENMSQSKSPYSRFRERLWLFLEDPTSSSAARVRFLYIYNIRIK